MKHTRSICLLLAGVLLAAAPALAQGSRQAPPTKDGFLIGFSLGFGSTFPCDECPSLAGSFSIGAMASSNVAIVADFGVVGGEDRDFGEPGSLAVGALAVQFWPTDRFWLKAGVGVGNTFSVDWDEHDWDDHWDSDVDTGKRRWAGIAAAGFEVVQKSVFTMDIQVRGFFIEGNQSVAVGIGFNWY